MIVCSNCVATSGVLQQRPAGLDVVEGQVHQPQPRAQRRRAEVGHRVEDDGPAGDLLDGLAAQVHQQLLAAGSQVMSTCSVGEPIEARVVSEGTVRSPTCTRARPARGTCTRKKSSNRPGTMRTSSP